MDRLTYRTSSGAANLYKVDEAKSDEVKKSVARQQAFDRLASYEDTGLMPDEIPHWIPVEKELPKYTDMYNCYCNIGSMGGGYQEVRSYRFERCGSKQGKWCIPNEPDEVVVITHWQPLPQPPKGEKS